MLGALRRRSWRDLPTTIFDFKRAKLLGRLGAKEIDLRKPPPTEPGLYIVRPAPVVDDQAVLDYLGGVYSNTHHGLYFDETLELGTRNRGFRRLLTQGRELDIPMIYCMQRPKWVDVYSLSEADYFMTFDLRNSDDVKYLAKFAPGYDPSKLDGFYSYWYDVGSDRGSVMRPVPGEAQVLSLYDLPTEHPIATEEAQQVLPSQTRVLL